MYGHGPNNVYAASLGGGGLYYDPYAYGGRMDSRERGRGGGGRKRKKLPKKQKTCYIITVLSMCLIGFALLIASLFAPRYHYVVLSSMLNTIMLDVGLLRVRADGKCRGNIVKVRAFDALCENLTQTLNDVTLSQVQVYACQAETIMFSLIPTGCDAISNVNLASWLLTLLLLFSILLSLFGGFLFVTFWTLKRSKKLRLAALASQLLSSAFLIVGLILYLLIGGVNIHLNIPIVMMDFVDFDLSAGFVVCVFATFWNALIPFAFYIGMPVTACSEKERRSSSDYENELLLDSLEAEYRRPRRSSYHRSRS